jgi:hypothetical protein
MSTQGKRLELSDLYGGEVVHQPGGIGNLNRDKREIGTVGGDG